MIEKRGRGRPRKYNQAMTEVMTFAVTPQQKELLAQFRDKYGPNYTGGTANFMRDYVLRAAAELVPVHPGPPVVTPTHDVSTPPAEQG